MYITCPSGNNLSIDESVGGGKNMKKNIHGIIVTLLLIIITIGFININTVKAQSKDMDNQVDGQEDITVEEIAEKLIRFHVIANSDGKADQELKLKVRDEVLKYIQPILKESTSIEESRIILTEKNEEILKIAERVIEENGYDYKVQSTLSKEYFPVKTYGNITLPQGQYEAYRIIIGSGEGQNWWCVMFPPICFVDITKGEVAYEETEKEMKSVLNEDEFNMVDNTSKENNKKTSKNDNKTDKNDNKSVKVVDNTEDKNVVVKFKVAEMFKGLMK